MAMIGMWYVEAGKYNVLPIDSRGTQRFAVERPQIAAERTRYEYFAGTQMVPSNTAPRLLNTSHSVSVDAVVPDGGADGVLFAYGGNDGGISFYVKDGKLTYGHNYVADSHFRVASSQPLPAGRHIISFQFEPTGKPDFAKGKGTHGKVTLLVDGKSIGEGSVPVTIQLVMGLGGGGTTGADPGSPTMTYYNTHVRVSGTLK